MSNESSVVRSVFKRVGRRPGEFCLMLLVPFLAIQLAMSGPVAGGHAPPPAGAAVGPVADWLDDVIDDLEDAADDLEDAESAVADPWGPVTGPDRAVVSKALDDVLLIIDRVLGHPNMMNAGSIDVEADVTALQDYAVECLVLAQDALHEAVSPRVDLESIATRLRTIEYLITREGPHNYQTQARIALSNQ